MFLRLYDLQNYPMILPDEGLWTFSPKNYVAFGDWFLGGRWHLFRSPMFHFLQIPVIYIAGYGIVQVRFVSAIFGILSLIGLYLLAKNLFDSKRIATISTLLFGFSAVSLQISRTALVESTQTCFLIWGFYFLSRQGFRNITLGGVLLAFACLTKLNAVYCLLPAYVLLLIGGSLNNVKRPSLTSLINPKFIGLLLIFLTIIVAVHGTLYFQHPDKYIETYRFELDGAGFTAEGEDPPVTGRFAIRPSLINDSIKHLLTNMPFLTLFSILALLECLVGASAGGIFSAAWFIGGSAFNMLQIYQPIRYYGPIVPAMCLLSAIVIEKRWGTEAIQFRLLKHTMRVSLASLIISMIVILNVGRVTQNYVRTRDHTPFLVTQWFNENAASESIVIGADYLLVPLKQKGLTFYGVEKDFETLFLDRETAHRLNIEYVIFDEREWGSYCREQNNGFEAYLQDQYTLAKKINYVSIFSIENTAEDPPQPPEIRGASGVSVTNEPEHN